MSEIFDKAFAHTIQIEGGFVNDPNDRGGMTYKGISRKNFPSWEGWPLMDMLIKDEYKTSTINKILEADRELQKKVKEFYYQEFWWKLRLDDIQDEAVQMELFDTGVNMGKGRAGQFLQKGLNLLNRKGKDYPDIKVDGQIGPNTLKAFRACKRKENLYKILNVLQGAYYVKIAENDPSQEAYMNGWLTRVEFKRI